MKTSFQKLQPALVLMYVLLFTSATCAFNSMACQLTSSKETAKTASEKEATAPAEKRVQMPVINPLQIFSKFM